MGGSCSRKVKCTVLGMDSQLGCSVPREGRCKMWQFILKSKERKEEKSWQALVDTSSVHPAPGSWRSTLRTAQQVQHTHTHLGDAWATVKITWQIKVTLFFPFILYSVKFFNVMLCKKWTLTARPCFIPTAQLPPWELFPKWCHYLSSFPSHRLNLQSLHINFGRFSLRLAAKTLNSSKHKPTGKIKSSI